MAGVPDLVGVVHGRFFGLEVKMPGEKATPVQQARLNAIARAGGIAAVVYSPEEAVRILQAATKKTIPGVRVRTL